MASTQDVVSNKKLRMFACLTVLFVIFLAGHLSWTNGIQKQLPWSLFFNEKWYNKILISESLKNKQDHIWFLETSYRRRLNAREACSIESACRHNADYTVHLLSSGNISSSYCPYHRLLSKLPNFRSAGLNASRELAGTPLAKIHAKEGALNRSPHKVEHLSDFLRLVVLWKRGGVYLDTDVIVMKSLKGIRNSVVYQYENGSVGNSILSFDKKHPVLRELIDECAREYNPGVWTSCGPLLMSRLPSDAVFSRRINFLHPSTFFGVGFPSWRTLFDPSKVPAVFRAINGSHGVHIWNKLSVKKRVVAGSGCAIDILARNHCPQVYKLAASKKYI
ncbi:lactosylceramide 4-alpha-galactosyltransferase-like isoform X1 [Dermacentor albipictus]|uniref:lactosylceramide 4-alpha-galactosyltransferase-like isoform X1 n=1 Tax=Dermacentor albipictus TaxID=60249 RepID=UPI0031FE2E9A